MSMMDGIERRAWLPVAAGICLVVAAVLGMLAYPRTRHVIASHLGVDSASDHALPETRLPQAAWKTKTFPAGIKGKASKTEKKLVDAQRAAVTETVRKVYDSLILRGNVDELGASLIAPEAAGALQRSKLADGKALADVQTTRRSALIGIDATSGKRAAAKVVVAVKATLKGKKVKLMQRSTLWLERKGKSWHVIAFDTVQKPRR